MRAVGTILSDWLAGASEEDLAFSGYATLEQARVVTAIAREMGLTQGDVPSDPDVRERKALTASLVELALGAPKELFPDLNEYLGAVPAALERNPTQTAEELLAALAPNVPPNADSVSRFRLVVAATHGRVLGGPVTGALAGQVIAEALRAQANTGEYPSVVPESTRQSQSRVHRRQADSPEPRRTPPEPGRDAAHRRAGSDSSRTDVARPDALLPRARSGAAPLSATLIMLESPTGAIESLFRKISVGLTVGRDPSNDFCLQHVSVSRSHAVFERTENSFFIRDLGSTNGTYVNRKAVTGSVRLHSDDQVQIGNYLLKFIVGDLAQEKLFDEVNTLLTTDRLTGALNLSYFEQELEKEAERAAHFHRPLSLLSVKIDGLDAINEEENTGEGDRIIREAVGVCRFEFGAVALLARHSANIYGALPEVSLEEAEHIGQSVVQGLKGMAGQQSMPSGRFRVSVGVATQMASQGMAAALRRESEEAQKRASALGGNRVVAFSVEGASSISRRIRRDPKHVVHRALAAAPGRALVIFEMASSVALFENLNAEQRESRFSQLLDNVLEETSPTDDVSRWGTQYVVASISERSRKERQRFADQVRARWLKNVVEDDDLELRAPRELRVAWLSSEEVVRFSDNCLDELTTRLLKTAERREGPQARLVARLPFVVAGPVSMIQAAHGQALRFDAARFAVERCFQFLSLTALSLVREQGDKAKWEQTARVLGPLREHLTMGAWAQVALALSKQVSPKGRLASVFQALAGSGEAVAGVVEMIEGAVQVRNNEAHGVPRLAPEAVTPHVERLLDTGGALLGAISPISRTRLVSYQGVNRVLRAGGYLLDVREHTGPEEHFPVLQVEFSKPLFEEKWCHLLEENEEPISLAPWMRAEVCPVCQRVELFVATQFLPNAKGEIRMVGVTSGHPNNVTVPAVDGEAAFWASVREGKSTR